MARENYTIEPQVHTVAELRKMFGWPEMKATMLLESFCATGIVRRAFHPTTGEEGYIITGAGLAAGEKLGIVKPFHPIHGYGDAEGKLPDVPDILRYEQK